MKDELYYRVSVKAGSAEYDLSRDISSLMVEESGAGPDMLIMELSDPFKVLSHALQEGMQVETDLGTVGDHSVVFRGRITKAEGCFPCRGVPTLRLLAYDRSLDMGLCKRNRIWTETTLEDIIREIATKYFNSRDITINMHGNPRYAGNGIRQDEETDLAFLLRLASAYSCEMYVETGENADKLFIRAQSSIMTSAPKVVLSYGRPGAENCLLDFEATVNVGDIQLPQVFAGMDFETGLPIEQNSTKVEDVGTRSDGFADENLAEFGRRYPERLLALRDLLAAAPLVQQQLRKKLGTEERETTTGFATEEDLGIRSLNRFSTSIYGMQGSGRTEGNHRIHAQCAVEICDVGGRFSGTWYLSRVRHVLDREGYKTEFQCSR